MILKKKIYILYYYVLCVLYYIILFIYILTTEKMLHKDVGVRSVLDRTPILFIKSELHCGRFVPLCN